ncbi:hypothetical protein AHAS_Ahas08G0070300 [Arachis hypogaea]
MEESVAAGSSSSSSSCSRWNPTKEQISTLEEIYNQGVRTPNPKEIKEIMERLKVYGPIEGKNVFYWFQNHKARQRQRQKDHHQQQLRLQQHHHHHPYFNRFLNSISPPISPTVFYNISVVRSPAYGLVQSEIGHFQNQHSNMVVSPRTDQALPVMKMPPQPISPRIEDVVPMMIPPEPIHPRTLDLFPQHPTLTLAAGRARQQSNHELANHNFIDFFTSPGRDQP